MDQNLNHLAAATELQEIVQRSQRARAVQHLLREAHDEMSSFIKAERNKGRFSIVRTCNAIATDGLISGAEAEIAREMACRVGQNYDPHRPTLPWEAFTRVLQVGTAAQGGNLVGTAVPPAVAALFPYTTVMRLGATVLPDQEGDVALPRVGTSAAAGWIAENGTATLSEPTIAQILHKPKHVAGFAQITRQMRQQAPGVDVLLERNILGAVGAAIDAAALVGTGTTQPTGIRNVAGVTVTAGASLANSAIQTMARVVLAGNAAESTTRFLGAPTVRELLGNRAANGTGSRYLWDGTNLAGYEAYTSGNVPAAHLFCGGWENLVIPMWGGLTLESDPYTNFRSGITGVRAIAACDVGVLQPSCFAVSTAIT
jgi:HK97 family phage major capsid protein